MSKFTKATKRIAAVAASAVMVSSAAFGAGLSSYPNNFVESGKFTGKVVVGSAASAMDTTTATSIIEDLKGEFSGSAGKVKITYKSKTAGAEDFELVDSSSALNYGEAIGTARSQKVDSGDLDVLADGTFKNGADDQDYKQEVTFSSTVGVFEHSLRTSAGESQISDNIYVDDNVNFMTYTLNMNSAVNFGTTYADQDAVDADFIGETLEILGNEYTITTFTVPTGTDLVTKIELIGGSNKVSLGEGESTSLTIDGKVYEISVQSVSTSNNGKVLLTVNGQSKSVAEFDTEEISGVSVAVTDIVASSRDAVKGYAEVVVGGHKLTLVDNSEVQINDEDFSDVYPGYYAEATISTTAGNFDGFSIDFQADDEMVLKSGDSFDDNVFQVLSVEYRGTNEPDYETLKFTESGDQIDADGKLIGGKTYSGSLAVYDGTFDGTSAYTLTGKDDGAAEDKMYISNSTSFPALNASTTKGIQFLTGDKDEQWVWELTRFDDVTNESDFKEVFSGSTNDKLSLTEWTDLDGNLGNPQVDLARTFNMTSASQFYDTLAFANERLVNLSDINGAGASTLVLSLDTEDTDGDDTTDDTETIVLTITDDTTDNKANIAFTSGSSNEVVFAGAKSDVADNNNDEREYVTKFGSIIREDAQDSEWVTVKTPEEQVYGKVFLNVGASAASSMSVTVDESMVADKKAELEKDGMTIVSSEAVSASAVSFGVTAPAYDADVSGMDDMIVVGGPAVNKVAAKLLGLSYPTYGAASGVGMDEAVVRYFADSNSVVVYGYEGKDTAAAAKKLNAGGLSGEVVNVQ